MALYDCMEENLTKDVRDHHYKILLRGIKDLNKWKDIWYS